MIYHLKKDMTGFNQFGKPIGYRSASAAGLLASKMPENGLIFYAPLNSVDGFDVAGSPKIITKDGITCIHMYLGARLYTTADGIPNGTSPRTLSCWFNLSEDCYVGDWVTMFGIGYSDWYQETSVCVDDRGRMALGGYGRDAIFSFYPERETFYHVAITFVDGEAKLYINGEYLQTAYVDGIDTTGNGIWVGGGNYTGEVAVVRVYNRVLTAAEIQQLSTEFTI